MALLPENYSCLFIDATWKDFLNAFSFVSSRTQERANLQSKVERLFGGSDKWLVSFSVRTALDVFLTVMNFPPGSEVILTAVNIPDMVKVVERHCLKVIPVDIDLDTLAPKPELIELAVTDKTVAILAAHLYGKRINLDKVFEVAQAHGLFVLEDCAESFHGLKWKGHQLSDLVLFSFGSIKYFTSLGGAIVKVRNPEILRKMRGKMEKFPVQSKWTYIRKLLRYSLIMMIGLNAPTMNWFFVKFFHALGIKYKEFFISLLRAFPGSLDIEQLHYQPSGMLLKFMLYKLTRVSEKDFRYIKLKGDFVRENLPSNVFVPGKKADITSYWLFPIIVDDPNEVCKALEKEGIEAYRGATQLRTVFRTKQVVDRPVQGSHEWASDKEKLGPSLTHTLSGTELAAGIGSSPLNSATSYKESASNSSSTTAEFLCSPAVEACRSSMDTLDKEKNDFLFPHNAKYLIDHVLYLPVHKRVPFWYLEHICVAVEKVMKQRIGVKINSFREVLLHSKL